MAQTTQKSLKDIVINTWPQKDKDGFKFYNVKDYDYLPDEFKEFIKKENDFRIDKDGMTFGVKVWDNGVASVSAWEKKEKTGGYGGPKNIYVKDFSCNYVEVCPPEAFNDLANTHQAKNGSKWQYLDTVITEDKDGNKVAQVVMGYMDPVWFKLGTTGDSEKESK